MKKSAGKTLSRIKGEMDEPRVAASARQLGRPSKPGKSTAAQKARVVELRPRSSLELSRSKKQAMSIIFGSILKEVERLKRVSKRLDLLADEHLTLTEALVPVSASIVRIATVLELVVISNS